MKSWRVVGMLSGTSMDGVDVACADLSLNGSTIELTPLGYDEHPYEPALRQDLVDALPPAPCSAAKLCELDTAVGQTFADAARLAIERHCSGHADLAASLGQTIYHWVEGPRCRGTLQLGQPAWIAEATGLPVVADLRARDVAAGGHGAPLAGTLDALWLADEPRTVALNIGGIANITVLDERLFAYDTGPGNALIDAAAVLVSRGALHRDTDGELARAGTVHNGLLDRLLSDPYYELQPPKSTGKEHFHTRYLQAMLEQVEPVDDADVLATLTELTAYTIAEACRRHGARRVVASGGGVSNPALMAALGRQLRPEAKLTTSDAMGLPSAGKEAYLVALLGFLTFMGQPGNAPSTTGARGPRVLGNITPGHTPLRFPEPSSESIHRLHIEPRRSP